MRMWLLILAIFGFSSGAFAQTPPAAVPVFPGLPADDDVIDLVFVQSKTPLFLRIHARRGGRSFPDVWHEYLTTLFEQLDTDGNGALSETEFEQGPWSRFRRGQAARASDLSFVDFDMAPRDDSISLAELTARMARFCAQIEFAGVRQRSRNDDHLFLQLDRNVDEHLDLDEVTNAFDQLRRLDRNDDEMLSRRDLQPELSELSNDFVSSRTRRQAPATAVIERVDGESVASLARRLFRHYDSAGRRRLSPAELALPAEDFTAADTNGDGYLTVGEWSNWFEHRAPDLEVIVELASTAAPTVQVVARSENHDALQRLSFDEQGALVAPSGYDQLAIHVRKEVDAAQTAQMATVASEQRAEQFARLDRDNNGYLDRQEMASGGMEELFVTVDRNGDGKIFLDELQNYATQQTALARHQVHVSISDRGSTLFDALDDGDQRLSRRELKRLPAVVSQWDRNGDGRLALDEIPRHYQVTIEPGQWEGMGIDGFLTRSVARSPDAATRKGPIWFQRMDRNGDGDLSPREFLGPIEMFRALDTDGDGLISAAEAQAAE